MKVLNFSGFSDKGINCDWSGNSSGIGGVGIFVKEELCKEVVDVRKKVTELWW